MGDVKEITERLKQLVIQRKTPIIENKRVIGHKPSRSATRSISSENYSFHMDD